MGRQEALQLPFFERHEKIHTDSVLCYIFLVLFFSLTLTGFLAYLKPTQLLWENLQNSTNSSHFYLLLSMTYPFIVPTKLLKPLVYSQAYGFLHKDKLALKLLVTPLVRVQTLLMTTSQEVSTQKYAKATPLKQGGSFFLIFVSLVSEHPYGPKSSYMGLSYSYTQQSLVKGLWGSKRDLRGALKLSTTVIIIVIIINHHHHPSMLPFIQHHKLGTTLILHAFSYVIFTTTPILQMRKVRIAQIKILPKVT